MNVIWRKWPRHQTLVFWLRWWSSQLLLHHREGADRLTNRVMVGTNVGTATAATSTDCSVFSKLTFCPWVRYSFRLGAGCKAEDDWSRGARRQNKEGVDEGVYWQWKRGQKGLKCIRMCERACEGKAVPTCFHFTEAKANKRPEQLKTSNYKTEGEKD